MTQTLVLATSAKAYNLLAMSHPSAIQKTDETPVANSKVVRGAQRRPPLRNSCEPNGKRPWASRPPAFAAPPKDSGVNMKARVVPGRFLKPMIASRALVPPYFV